MKLLTILPFLALTITSCTPAAMEGLGRGLAQGATGAAPQSLGLTCSGKTFGSLTSADAELSLTVTSSGQAEGTFTNNGTVFYADGLASLGSASALQQISTLNLKLDSRVQGGAVALLGVKTAGLAGTFGSTGTLTGNVSGGALLTGSFKGIQGTYRVAMTCSAG